MKYFYYTTSTRTITRTTAKHVCEKVKKLGNAKKSLKRFSKYIE